MSSAVGRSKAKEGGGGQMQYPVEQESRARAKRALRHTPRGVAGQAGGKGSLVVVASADRVHLHFISFIYLFIYLFDAAAAAATSLRPVAFIRAIRCRRRSN